MNFLCIFVALFGGIAIDTIRSVKVVNGNDPGSCDQSNHADEVLVRDREDKDKVLICTQSDGAYQWRTIDGLSPHGEFFNPGYDCSDILDKDMEAKDGFYWVQFDGSTPKKVWCDMTTDGGGFMLIGHKNSSITWTVPSNDDPVEPLGFPHWSSALGDTSMLDFRIQMSSSADFKLTKTHWSFRFNNKRPLKNLMIMGEKGCDRTSPGIGDIAYVKDLQTEKIVTTTFRCSKFGMAHLPQTKLGWSMMNSCLQKPCPWGFAFHHKYPIQLDFSGAFSYSATGIVSGIVYNATAFVGCNKGHCCGCYGPVGGTENYCSKDCQAINGGTVITNVYTWFWVRSTLPKRVWNKCMEYKVTKDNGESVWYKLIGGNVIPSEGRCVRSEALLNEGIVVVPDADSAESIPPVAGLIAYRQDNKELYVRANKTWNVLAQEQKVLQQTSEIVKPKLNEFEKKIRDHNQKVMNMLGTEIVQLDSKLGKQLGNQNRTLETGLLKVNSILDRLEKQLQDVNKTVANSRLYDALSYSVILNRGQNYLSQLKQWLPEKSKWNLCYRATSHGWRVFDFHSRCDYKGSTVTIIRVGSYVFGGYTDQSWDGNSGSKSSTKSFIFSLRNKDNLPPFKAPVYQNSGSAIYSSSSYGPTFGGGFDINIRDNAHSNTGSITNFGYTYQPPSGYSYSSSNTRALLAGSYNSFYVSEIEVFYLR